MNRYDDENDTVQLHISTNENSKDTKRMWELNFEIKFHVFMKMSYSEAFKFHPSFLWRGKSLRHCVFSVIVTDWHYKCLSQLRQCPIKSYTFSIDLMIDYIFHTSRTCVPRLSQEPIICVLERRKGVYQSPSSAQKLEKRVRVFGKPKS